MFDIGFPELILVCIVALLVLGPERMPEAIRALGLWLGRLRRNFTRIKDEIEREVGMDDVRRQLHNEAILDEIRRIEGEVKGSSGEDNRIAPNARPNNNAPTDVKSGTGDAGDAGEAGDTGETGDAGDAGTAREAENEKAAAPRAADLSDRENARGAATETDTAMGDKPRDA